MSAPVVMVRRGDAGWSVTGPREFAAGTRCNGHGVYAGWRIDDAGGLTIEHDRYGVHPFFYSVKRDTLWLSTSVTALLDAVVSRVLDDAAMAVFLRAGFFVGDDTPFQAIRAVPPSASLTWGPAGPSLRSQWRPPNARRGSREDDVAAM